MSIVKEKYNTSRINLLYQMLVNDTEQGSPRDYDIKVDELKVVQRTNDPERFFLHEEFVQPDTACITINIYDGSSRRCTKYQLYFGDVQPNATTPTLSGIENTIKEKISNERMQWDYEQVKKEKEGLDQRLADAEQYAEELETKLESSRQELEDFKKKRIGMAEMNTGKLFGFATDYLVKSHPALAQRLPFISGLSGLLLEEEVPDNALAGPATSDEPSPNNTATFSKKNTEAVSTYDPTTENKLNFFRQMEEAFTIPQLEKVIEIILDLAARPEQVDTIHAQVHSPSSKDQAANSPDMH